MVGIASLNRMPRCQAFKQDHETCTRNATRGAEDHHPEHLHLCGQHKRIYTNDVLAANNVHHTPGRCFRLVQTIGRARTWIWCPSAVEGDQMLCPLHEAQRQDYIQQGEERLNNRAIIGGLVEGILAQDPPVPWRRAVVVLAAMVDVTLVNRRLAAFEYFHHPRTRELEPLDPTWLFPHYWEWVRNGQLGPQPHAVNLPAAPAPRLVGLGALARDQQNVHTRVVTEQTNKATEKLLAVKVPDTQQTERTLTLVWLGHLGIPYGNYINVAIDINKWFNTKDCRVEDDSLYRKLLRGLVALIVDEKDEERKKELYRRVWEECEESVGMCCEGHISRLCNVLVGFDESFEHQVSLGELTQQKMAAIAAQDIPEADKRKQANEFFNEHKVPHAERDAWLDAF